MTSERLHVTTQDLAERWTFDDLMLAHDVLDAIDTAEIRAMPRKAN